MYKKLVFIGKFLYNSGNVDTHTQVLAKRIYAGVSILILGTILSEE